MTTMDERPITVYRDDPAWDQHERWFQVPSDKLRDLFVARYIVRGEDLDHADVARHAKTVFANHPGCVLVY